MGKIYKPLQTLTEDEIERILLDDNIQELITLPLSVGETFPHWKVSQDLCIKLSEYPDPRVRANSILGLAYIARTKGKLEKYVVKPVILRALREETEYKWRIIDALKDINLFMGWNIGAKWQL